MSATVGGSRGFLCWNEQWGFRQPPGWFSQ